MKRQTKKGIELKLQEIDIHMGLFDFSVVVVIGKYSKIGEYVRWMFKDKDFNPETWDMGYEPRGKCFFRSGYVPIIWIPQKPKTAREYGTLAHESLHAVFHLFEWANLPVTKDTEEVMAHSVAHIINEVLK